MKPKILFIIPAIEDNKNNNLPKYPLAPFRLEAYCRDIADFSFLLGNSVDNIDLNIDIISITTIFVATDNFTSKVLDIISYNSLLSLILEIRDKTNAKIFLGGHLPKYKPEIEKYVDWCCYYEGEKPFRNAIQNFINNKPLINSKEYEILSQEELDSIPPIDIKYFDKILPLQIGIGCRSSCIFCSSPFSQGKKIRHQSTEKIIEDLNFYKKNIEKFFVIDDDLFSDSNHYKKIFQYMANNKLYAEFPQIPIYLEKEELELLLPLTTIFNFSPDACNEKIFKLTNKKGSFENFEKLVKFIYNKKMFSILSAQFIINYPEETEDDRKEAIELFSNLPLWCVTIFPLTIMENSILDKKLNLTEEEKFSFYLKGKIIADEMMGKINLKLQNEKIKNSIYYPV